MATLMTAFDFLLKRGLAQTKGSINGPTSRKETIKEPVLKYHFSRF